MIHTPFNLTACTSCGARLRPGARFCARCGAAAMRGDGQRPRRLSLDGVRDEWRQAAPGGTNGPLELKLGADERPILWLAGGDSPILLTSRAETGRVVRLMLEPGRVRSVDLGTAPFAAIRAVAATAVGAFVVQDDRLVGLHVRDATASASPPLDLLPRGAAATGLCAGGDGRIYALVRQDGRLALYGGFGLAPLHPIASVQSGAYRGGWLDLAIAAAGPSSAGSAAFWGGGVLGRVDLRRGEMLISVDDRAPERPLNLTSRNREAPVAGTFAGSAAGALPTTADGGAGWGLLNASHGSFEPAPADLASPLAATGFGPGRALAITSDGIATLFSGSAPGSGGPLATRFARNWRGMTLQAAALGADTDCALALVGSGSELSAHIVRADADQSPVLAGSTQMAVEQRRGAAPTAIPSMPPLALSAGFAAAALMDELAIWLAPWTEPS